MVLLELLLILAIINVVCCSQLFLTTIIPTIMNYYTVDAVIIIARCGNAVPALAFESNGLCLPIKQQCLTRGGCCMLGFWLVGLLQDFNSYHQMKSTSTGERLAPAATSLLQNHPRPCNKHQHYKTRGTFSDRAEKNLRSTCVQRYFFKSNLHQQASYPTIIPHCQIHHSSPN